MKKYPLFIVAALAVFLMGCSDGKSTETNVTTETKTKTNETTTINQPTNAIAPQKDGKYITVKYRDSQVDVSSFETVNISEESDVKGAWYDATNQYMIITLNKTSYQYCLLPAKIWSEFKMSKDLYKRFQSNIKGNYDCRKGGVPTYESDSK